jgi:hypothetical protein
MALMGAFHEPTVFSLDQVIVNLFPPGVEQLQEIIETVQTTVLDLLCPALDLEWGVFLGEVHLEERCELFSQDISLFCQLRMLRKIIS